MTTGDFVRTLWRYAAKVGVRDRGKVGLLPRRIEIVNVRANSVLERRMRYEAVLIGTVGLPNLSLKELISIRLPRHVLLLQILDSDLRTRYALRRACQGVTDRVAATLVFFRY